MSMEELKLFSRRNEVTLRDGQVYKQMKDPQAAALEADILRELHGKGVPVPALLDCRGALLVMEYLPGDPLPDVIERGAYDPGALAHALCAWFAAFYAAMPPGALRGDVNGRNFLCGGENIYGVDFEERCFGPRSRDAGRLAAFIETYRTTDSNKQAALSQAFMQNFSEQFGCTAEEISAAREAELDAMRERRGAPQKR